MSTPKLTIGLPVYNGEKYLRLALDSILAQDYADFELIISDNASGDATAEICREYETKDRRIRYVRNKANIGARGNYLRVLELAQGEYFKWHPYDDECHPQMLSRCVEVLDDTSPSVVLVFPGCDYVNEDGEIIQRATEHIGSFSQRPHVRLRAVLSNVVAGHAFYGVMRTDALRRTRKYGIIAADWVLLAEMSLLGYIREIPEALYRYRLHSEQALAVHRTRREMLVWQDPALASKRPILTFRVAVIAEYLKGIWFLPLSWAERILCWGTAIIVPYWRLLLWKSGPIRHRFGLYRKHKRSANLSASCRT